MRLIVARATLVAGPLLTAVAAPAWASVTVAPESFGASGSYEILTCATTANSNQITCPTPGVFQVGQGILVKAAGGPPHGVALASTPAPTVTREGADTSTGTHTYCYVVAVGDPYHGIQAPSAPSCLTNQPDLSVNSLDSFKLVPEFHAVVDLSSAPKSLPDSKIIPLYLWYSSIDGADYRLMYVGNESNADPTGAVYNSSEAIRPNGDYGGWPATLPFSGLASVGIRNQDLISTVQAIAPSPTGAGVVLSLAASASMTLSATPVQHDDTAALQAAIDYVGANGGGMVQFAAHSYRFERPSFYTGNLTAPYTSDLAGAPSIFWWGAPHLVHTEAAAPSNLTLLGTIDAQGNHTLLDTGPSFTAGGGALLLISDPETAASGGPPYHPGVLAILPVDKGARSVQLANPSQAAGFSAGDDVWLYSGTFDQNQPTSPSQACANQIDPVSKLPYANNCHFSELNTVVSLDKTSGKLALALPVTKKYWNDGYSSFGLVRLSQIAHNITLQNLDVLSYTPLLYGAGYNISFIGIRMHNVANMDFLGTGTRRGLTIENSTLSWGSGSQGWINTQEFDQVEDVTVSGNTFTGYAAPRAEGPSQGARLYFTEGTTNLRVRNNTFQNFQLLTQAADAVSVTHNKFKDSVAWVGLVHESPYQPFTDFSYVSFASQHGASITSNTFQHDLNYQAFTIVWLGTFGDGNVNDNTFTYASVPTWIVYTAGGNVARNTINVSTPTDVNHPGAVEVVIDDVSQPVAVRSNVVTGALPFVVNLNPPYAPTETVCILGNTLNGRSGDVPVSTSVYFNGYNFAAACPQIPLPD
ncbi:MAG: hypothetical protein JO133_01330 [Burkholderiaceae bacterium]|nr:hypothetical protein [Burkholderiaceae bacterium]